MFVNYDLRRAAIDDKPITDYGMDVVYPRNVTLPNYLYFCVAPTLCYQPSYPRNPRFRRFFFAKRLLEFVTLLGVMYFLIEQVAFSWHAFIGGASCFTFVMFSLTCITITQVRATNVVQLIASLPRCQHSSSF